MAFLLPGRGPAKAVTLVTTTTLFMLLAVVVFIGVDARIVGDGTAANPLQVGCQRGTPPFVDSTTAEPECHGYMADIFHTIMNRTGWAYNITMLNTDHIDDFLVSNASKPISDYDFVIAFHSITPDRLEQIKFSIVIYSTDYRVSLLPKYRQTTSTLVDSITREAVLHLFAIAITIASICSVVFFIFEQLLSKDSDIKKFPLWRKVLFALEMGLDVVFAGATGTELKNPISKFVRLLGTVISLVYVMNIFGAIVTSQLTASALAAGNPSVRDIRNTRIAISTTDEIVIDYLRGLEVGATLVDVPNIEDFADRFYKGLEPDFEGFVAESDIVNVLFNQHGGEAAGYAFSDAFVPTGSKELKAFPFATNGLASILEDFNVEAQRMRDSGEFTTIGNKWLPSPPGSSANEFPVPKSAYLGLRVFSIVGIALFVVVTLVLFVIHLATGKEDEAENDEDEEEKKKEPSGEGEEETKVSKIEDNSSATTTSLKWRGRDSTVSAQMEGVVDAMVAQLVPHQDLLMYSMDEK